MTIGEVAKKTGVTVQAIRYYERRGLLPLTHRWPDSGYRNFDDEAVSCLRFICFAKSVGFTLDQTKDLLELRFDPANACEEGQGLLNGKISEIDGRIATLAQWRATLKGLLKKCASSRSRNLPCMVLTAQGLFTDKKIDGSEKSGLEDRRLIAVSGPAHPFL